MKKAVQLRSVHSNKNNPTMLYCNRSYCTSSLRMAHQAIVSGTSLEANLVRIKFFRNELYGHVATTAINTPTFSALWQEISAALVTLGLHRAEIDRLKAEHCGAEDFLDVLFEWADSEEDIKSPLS